MRKKGVILVVDDEPEIRSLLLDCLKVHGYTVLTAGDAPHALKILEAHPEIELLLTDVVMPGGMNGFDLGRAAMRQNQDLQVLYMSGYAVAEMMASAMRTMPTVLQKPFRFDLVLEKIGNSLQSGTA